MANTTTTTSNDSVAGELRHLDPETLVIDTNIRTTAALTKEFIASVGDGIRLPVLAVDTSEGVLVRDGQRRTLAAREAGLATIPVYIVPTVDGDDDKAATAARIIDQMVANTHRTNLSRRDEVTAIEQLSLAGLSATKISKSVRTSKKQVDHALATASSASALDAFETHGELTLEQAATLAQYDDDPDATARLLTGATQGRFEHVAQHLADTAAERALVRTAIAEYAEQGIAATGNQPAYHGQAQPLTRLADADGNAVEDIEHVEVAYRLAYVSVEFDEHWTNANGEPVDEDLIDWSLDEDDPEDTPKDGLLDIRSLTRTEDTAVATQWYVTDPEAAGLQARTYGYGSAGADPMPTDAELDAQKEADRQARRQTIALNKKAEAALQVRREKIAEYLARKTLPKGAVSAVAEFLAATMWNNHDLFGYHRQDGNAKALTRQFLGGTEPVEAMAGASAERRHIVEPGHRDRRPRG
jgi:ParB family chromosome partitioning protein